MESNNTNKSKLSPTGKLVLKVLLTMILFYVVVFLVWNFTSPNHKPSSLFFDWRKEGYQSDPLHDRLKPGN